MLNESIQEGKFVTVATSISITDFVPIDPYLFVCEVTGKEGT